MSASVPAVEHAVPERSLLGESAAMRSVRAQVVKISAMPSTSWPFWRGPSSTRRRRPGGWESAWPLSIARSASTRYRRTTHRLPQSGRFSLWRNRAVCFSETRAIGKSIPLVVELQYVAFQLPLAIECSDTYRASRRSGCWRVQRQRMPSSTASAARRSGCRPMR